jgi:hypothetical protein
MPADEILAFRRARLGGGGSGGGAGGCGPRRVEELLGRTPIFFPQGRSIAPEGTNELMADPRRTRFDVTSR